jgi:hypothetical protein
MLQCRKKALRSTEIRMANEAGQTFTARHIPIPTSLIPHKVLGYLESFQGKSANVRERERERSNHGNIDQKTLNMIENEYQNQH